MPSFDELQKQIRQLQQQADELRKTEIGKVLGMLHTSMQQYDITLADLGLCSLKGSEAKKTRVV